MITLLLLLLIIIIIIITHHYHYHCHHYYYYFYYDYYDCWCYELLRVMFVYHGELFRDPLAARRRGSAAGDTKRARIARAQSCVSAAWAERADFESCLLPVRIPLRGMVKVSSRTPCLDHEIPPREMLARGEAAPGTRNENPIRVAAPAFVAPPWRRDSQGIGPRGAEISRRGFRRIPRRRRVALAPA